MDQKSLRILSNGITGLYLTLAFLYITFVVRPVLCFHHVQPPFLLTSDFLISHLKSPGGFSQWVALVLMQSFHSKVLGPLIFFGLALVIWVVTRRLLNGMNRSLSNGLMAFLPFTFSIVLVNNYNFPFSVILSHLFVILALWLLSAPWKTLTGRLLCFTAEALLIWYISGSGFLLLFSMMALFFTIKRGDRKSLLSLVWVSGSAFLIPLLVEGEYLWFFPEKPYFMAYEPSSAFFIFIFSVPLLLLVASVVSLLPRKLSAIKARPEIPVALGFVLLIGMALFAHLVTFRPDAKKIVASDYYCYHHDARRTARAATSLENYSFSANVNYNLAITRNGTLTRDFFNFFQISGTDALYPDVDFSPEMLLIAADFYYELGYISEARHQAYEALVFYPYSPRALQLLVKVHLVTGEYKAADRCLRILDMGLVSREAVKAYLPYIGDTSRIRSNKELMEKRSFIPAEMELSPHIDQRFRDLLEANRGNKLAYEYLMLYYLLDGQLDPFMELYTEVGSYFDEPVGIYEEAILMYGLMNRSDLLSRYQISQATLDRFGDFGRTRKKYEGDRTMARNVLYSEMGQSYMYYLGYLYPRIVKPEMTKDDDDEAPL
ncbi:MAG: DUF6057 family protein [Bacteroidales bacterium]